MAEVRLKRMSTVSTGASWSAGGVKQPSHHRDLAQLVVQRDRRRCLRHVHGHTPRLQPFHRRLWHLEPLLHPLREHHRHRAGGNQLLHVGRLDTRRVTGTSLSPIPLAAASRPHLQILHHAEPINLEPTPRDRQNLRWRHISNLPPRPKDSGLGGRLQFPLHRLPAGQRPRDEDTGQCEAFAPRKTACSSTRSRILDTGWSLAVPSGPALTRLTQTSRHHRRASTRRSTATHALGPDLRHTSGARRPAARTIYGECMCGAQRAKRPVSPSVICHPVCECAAPRNPGRRGHPDRNRHRGRRN